MGSSPLRVLLEVNAEHRPHLPAKRRVFAAPVSGGGLIRSKCRISWSHPLPPCRVSGVELRHPPRPISEDRTRRSGLLERPDRASPARSAQHRAQTTKTGVPSRAQASPTAGRWQHQSQRMSAAGCGQRTKTRRRRMRPPPHPSRCPDHKKSPDHGVGARCGLEREVIRQVGLIRG